MCCRLILFDTICNENVAQPKTTISIWLLLRSLQHGADHRRFWLASVQDKSDGSLKSLGVILYDMISTDRHVMTTVCTFNCHIWALRHLWEIPNALLLVLDCKPPNLTNSEHLFTYVCNHCNAVPLIPKLCSTRTEHSAPPGAYQNGSPVYASCISELLRWRADPIIESRWTPSSLTES